MPSPHSGGSCRGSNESVQPASNRTRSSCTKQAFIGRQRKTCFDSLLAHHFSRKPGRPLFATNAFREAAMTLAIRHLALATAMLAAAAGRGAFGQAPAPASAPPPQSQVPTPAGQPERSVRTGKERLGQKWTDEQRV